MPGYRFGLGQRQSGDQGRRDFTGLRGFVHVRAPCVEGQAQAREQFAAVGRGRGKDQAHQGWGARARSTTTRCRSMRRRASSDRKRSGKEKGWAVRVDHGGGRNVEQKKEEYGKN